MRPRKEPSNRLDLCAFRLLGRKKQLLQAYAADTEGFSELMRNLIDGFIAANQATFDQIAARLPEAPANINEGTKEPD